MSRNLQDTDTNGYLAGRVRAEAPTVLISLGLIAALTLVLWTPKVSAPNQSHLIFFYLVPIATVAFAFGSIAGFIIAGAAALLGIFFLYDPLYTFYFTDWRDLGEVVCFVLVALLGTKCACQLRRR